MNRNHPASGRGGPPPAATRPPPAPLEDRPSVLLVDDRPENLLALEAVLGPLDARLVSVGSGEAALRALLSEDFSAILLDVQMPGMDGFETAACIKQRERTRNIPIIFLTALSKDIGHVFRGYEVGAVDYLLKPFDPRILRSKVGVFCDLERQRRARARSDELVRKAFDAAPGGIALTDPAGVLLRVNPALCAMVGSPPEELVGTRLVDLLPAADRDNVARGIADLEAERSEEVRCETHLTVGPGGDFAVALVASPVRDGPMVSQLLIQVHDIRERLAAEHARAELRVAEAARAEAEAAYGRERAIAEALQRELLPEQLPTVPGVGVAASFRPGGPETQVGGDWYDAIALPGGRMGLVVGDVAGRGVMAAARMGQLRSVARAYALEGHAPAVVAERLNHYHVALGADQMTTLVYAIVEPDTARLRYANAGHPPPLLAVPGEAPRLLTGVSPPLGASEVWRFEEREVDFPAGATLVLYTDGLVERRSEGIDAGLDRMRSSFVAGADVGEVCERLLAQSPAAAGADDDVTVLVARCLPQLGTPARFILGPDRDALVALRRALRRWLAEVGATDGEMDGMIMAANEAWQNAIEHGNAFSRAPIDVEFAVADGEVVVSVRDAGTPGGPSDPDRGRGVDLMHALVDSASVELGPHGGVVTLRQTMRAPRPRTPVGSPRTGADGLPRHAGCR